MKHLSYKCYKTLKKKGFKITNGVLRDFIIKKNIIIEINKENLNHHKLTTTLTKNHKCIQLLTLINKIYNTFKNEPNLIGVSINYDKKTSYYAKTISKITNQFDTIEVYYNYTDILATSLLTISIKRTTSKETIIEFNKNSIHLKITPTTKNNITFIKKAINLSKTQNKEQYNEIINYLMTVMNKLQSISIECYKTNKNTHYTIEWTDCNNKHTKIKGDNALNKFKEKINNTKCTKSSQGHKIQ